MSGHNKWSKIKHKKSAEDTKKSKLFSVLVKTITIEAKKAGGDVNNPNLKAAIDRAKAANMPGDNIDRAVKKGASAEAANLDQVIYETYGPGGAVLLIEGITDNRNRTTAEIKHILSKNGLSLGAQGSCLWAFETINNQWQTKIPITLNNEDYKKLEQIMAVITDHEDINNIYTNAEPQ